MFLLIIRCKWPQYFAQVVLFVHWRVKTGSNLFFMWTVDFITTRTWFLRTVPNTTGVLSMGGLGAEGVQSGLRLWMEVIFLKVVRTTTCPIRSMPGGLCADVQFLHAADHERQPLFGLFFKRRGTGIALKIPVTSCNSCLYFISGCVWKPVLTYAGFPEQ